MTEYFNYLCHPYDLHDYLDHVKLTLSEGVLTYNANVASYTNAFSDKCTLCYDDPCDPCKKKHHTKDPCGFDKIAKCYGTSYGCLYGCCGDPYSSNWNSVTCSNPVSSTDSFGPNINTYYTKVVNSGVLSTDIIGCTGLIKN